MDAPPVTNDDRPSHGPYGELWFDDAPDEKRWKVRLTDAGKAFVVEQIDKWGGAVSKLLWHKYRPFARYVSRLAPKDEIEQHCRVGFVIAATKYQPERGEFATFAAAYLRQTCQVCIEDPRTWKNVGVMCERRRNGVGSARLVTGFLDDAEKFHVLDEKLAREGEPQFASDQTIIKHKVDEWLEKVPKRHAHIVREYIVGERSLQSIGDELGISKERVRQLVNSTKQRLGYVITPEEYQKVVGL